MLASLRIGVSAYRRNNRRRVGVSACRRVGRVGVSADRRIGGLGGGGGEGEGGVIATKPRKHNSPGLQPWVGFQKEDCPVRVTDVGRCVGHIVLQL